MHNLLKNELCAFNIVLQKFTLHPATPYNNTILDLHPCNIVYGLCFRNKGGRYYAPLI